MSGSLVVRDYESEKKLETPLTPKKTPVLPNEKSNDSIPERKRSAPVSPSKKKNKVVQNNAITSFFCKK